MKKRILLSFIAAVSASITLSSYGFTDVITLTNTSGVLFGTESCTQIPGHLDSTLTAFKEAYTLPAPGKSQKMILVSGKIKFGSTAGDSVQCTFTTGSCRGSTETFTFYRSTSFTSAHASWSVTNPGPRLNCPYTFTMINPPTKSSSPYNYTIKVTNHM